MNKLFYNVIAILLLLSQQVKAQESDTFLKYLSLSAGVSTTGIGLQLAAPLNSHWGIRSGVNVLPVDFSYTYHERIYKITIDAKARLLNGNILADWYPKENGIFHVSTGLYFGKTAGDGIARSADSYILLDDVLTPEDLGTADVKVRTAFLKPYLGIGIRHFFSGSRFGFSCELGAMYHGTPDVEVTNNSVFSLSIGDLDEFREEVVKYKFYPVLSIQLVYKLF